MWPNSSNSRVEIYYAFFSKLVRLQAELACRRVMNRYKTTGAHTSSVSVYGRNIKKCMGEYIEESYIVNLYRGMSKSKLKINVNLPQLLCIVVSVALYGEFERFGGFCVDCHYTL